jgi:DNA polymerase I
MSLYDVLEMDMAIIPMVLDMQKFGIKLDPDALELLDVIFSGYRDETLDAIIQCDTRIPSSFNPGSSQQTTELLFDTLKLPGVFGRNTNDKTLSRITDSHPIVPLIKQWRGYQKLLTSYVRALPKLIGEDGRIHAKFQITRVETGRLSCKEPNLMAQPVRSSEGRMLRDCFVAESGNTLASFDYSGIEMRVCAHVSKDPRMCGIFQRGEDLHSMTASMMFGIPVESVDDMAHRYPAKRVGFGILYGLTAKGLAREMQVAGLSGDIWTEEYCDRAIATWFDVYSGVREFMDETTRFARQYGYVQDMWGRIRRVPGVYSPSKSVRAEAERKAGNAPIQSGAQGVIKKAMAALTPFYKTYSDAVWPLIQIHDDLLWEISREMLPDVLPMIKGFMEGVEPSEGDWEIPILVDVKAGVRWGSMGKYH